jgi:hypothetical protein
VKKVFVLLVLSIFVSSAAYGMDMSKHIGFGVWGGGVMPVGGNFSSGTPTGDKMSDVLGMYGFPSIEIKYVIIDKVAVGANLGYFYMPIKDDWKEKNLPDLKDETPALNMPFVSLNGTFNFGPLMKAEKNMFNPFVTAGVGMYSWYFAKNERTDKLPAPADTTQEFKASSFGINFGAGAEYFASSKFSVFGRINYHVVMMKDKDKFGKDFANEGIFGNQGFLTFGAGITYYLFTGKK